MPFLLPIKDGKACVENAALAKGLNIKAGKILHKGVADAFNA
jgi:alanine dehydrogenase